jgi:hypothetical protein
MGRKKEKVLKEEEKNLEPKIHQPPAEGELGRLYRVICDNSECGYIADIWISKTAWWIGALATCPYCDHDMCCDHSTINISIQARGAGAHSGTIGDRKKRMMIERSEKLKKKQWSDHEPINVPEGRKVRNPTEGGPLDPNGPFAKKPKNPVFSLPGSESEKPKKK